ncbi:MAG: hypothetical protein EOM83_11625 [Clostridia bacterium]|nr:hypothetical protein [Clostridia bacterium]
MPLFVSKIKFLNPRPEGLGYELNPELGYELNPELSYELNPELSYELNPEFSYEFKKPLSQPATRYGHSR